MGGHGTELAWAWQPFLLLILVWEVTMAQHIILLQDSSQYAGYEQTILDQKNGVQKNAKKVGATIKKQANKAGSKVRCIIAVHTLATQTCPAHVS